jgi:hypothetical protein
VNVERSYVLNVGSIKIDKGPFEERGLRLLEVSPAKVRRAANRARTIVIAEPPGRIGLVRERLESLKPIADDFGLVFALLVSPKELNRIKSVVAEVGITAPTSIRLLKDLGHTAEFARRDPGPPVGEVKIFPRRKLDSRIRQLLRRSFHDCDRIYLESLSGGRAALNVFCVHAYLRKSLVGPRPLPFFIKIANSDEIKNERENYRLYADFFIPFYLRPNVVPERCVRTEPLSSIVGNFVDESQPMRAVLRASQSPGVIFSLFENSLKGFRAQPPDGVDDTRNENLADFVKARARASEIDGAIIKSAQDLGLASRPVDVEAALIEKIKGVQRPFRAYHGDLHPGNVMVRGKDAIVIDFSAVKRGPITSDPVTLEVGLVFGTDSEDALKDFEEWKLFVDEIYKGVPIHKPPLPETNPGPFSWLRRAVREVRHILLGCDCEQNETAAVLATYLLRFARLDVEMSGAGAATKLARLRHSYALVVAERLTSTMPAGKPSPLA